MSASRDIPVASPQLLRILVRQNEEALHGLLSMPPSNHEGAAARAHRMVVEDLRDQTLRLNARLDLCARNPEAPCRRLSWRDLAAPR